MAHRNQQRNARSSSSHQRSSVNDRSRGRQINRNQGYYQKPKRSKKPLILLIILILVCAGVFAAIKLKASDKTDSSIESSSSIDSSEISSTLQSDSIVMTLGGSQDTYVLKGEEYIESGCHAFDSEDGNITDKVEISGKVNTNEVRDYEVKYSVKNSRGEMAAKVRNVHVVDSMDADTDGIPVLMYHFVYTKDDVPDDLNNNYILDTDLEEQLKWLSSEGYYYPSYQELAAYVEGTHSLPKKSVILTFDDGEWGFLDYGIPLLEKYKVPATSFIICDRDTASQKIHDYASEYVSFQSHSYGMHNAGPVQKGRGGMIWAMSEDEVVEDAKKAIALLGTSEAFAYPYGDVSEVAPSGLKKAGVLCAFTIKYDQVHKGDDLLQLPRIRIQGENSLETYKSQVQ